MVDIYIPAGPGRTPLTALPYAMSRCALCTFWLSATECGGRRSVCAPTSAAPACATLATAPLLLLYTDCDLNIHHCLLLIKHNMQIYVLTKQNMLVFKLGQYVRIRLHTGHRPSWHIYLFRIVFKIFYGPYKVSVTKPFYDWPVIKYANSNGWVFTSMHVWLLSSDT